MWKPSAKTGPAALGLVVLLGLAGCAATPEPRAASAEPDNAAAMANGGLTAADVAAFEQGLGLLRQARYQPAAEVLSPIAKAHPELPGPLVNLAIAYIHLDRQQEAVAALQRALAADPEHPVALNWMAILHRRSGRFEEAKAVYQRLLSGHPDYRYGHLNLGILCDLYLQDPDCALEHYKRYRDLSGLQDPEERQVSLWISDLERRSKR